MITYNFTGYDLNLLDDQTVIAGMTDISELLGYSAMVTLANLTGFDTAEPTVAGSMFEWTAGNAPPSDWNSAVLVVEEMSGRPVETTLNFMFTYFTSNDYLISAGTAATGLQFLPGANINKSSQLSAAQLSQLLGYQASTRQTVFAIAIALACLGLVALLVGLIFVRKFRNAKKLAIVTSWYFPVKK